MKFSNNKPTTNVIIKKGVIFKNVSLKNLTISNFNDFWYITAIAIVRTIYAKKIESEAPIAPKYFDRMSEKIKIIAIIQRF